MTKSEMWARRRARWAAYNAAKAKAEAALREAAALKAAADLGDLEECVADALTSTHH